MAFLGSIRQPKFVRRLQSTDILNCRFMTESKIEPLDVKALMTDVLDLSSEAQQRIQELHYSDENGQFSKNSNLLRDSLTVFPALSRWSILADAALHPSPNLTDILGPNLTDVLGPNLTDVLGPNLATIMNQLTTLELLDTDATVSKTAPSCVQRLLCMAPNLLHFKAKGDPLDTAMEPHWVCRNLQTFQIQPHNRLQPKYRGPRECFMLTWSSAAHVSGIFTLITQCLLSELKGLEKLVLRTSAEPYRLPDRDLDLDVHIGPTQPVHSTEASSLEVC
ncbi:hypothetical protein BGZ65_007721 [Modicella reniformis]|uniref:Uncharacterized protein n=1 Tax=Modicella reniformis TaxID=1440133 RepID=A0A9P6IK65_9FUNG|nr:hypothetical protein BGZ65_007721 [Modicella reniformis]